MNLYNSLNTFEQAATEIEEVIPNSLTQNGSLEDTLSSLPEEEIEWIAILSSN